MPADTTKPPNSREVQVAAFAFSTRFAFCFASDNDRGGRAESDWFVNCRGCQWGRDTI